MSARKFFLGAPLIMLLACCGLVRAEALPDPTKPPAVVEAPGAAEAPAASGLQTIIHRKGAKPAAVINGQYVQLGGRVGDARLVEVGEDAVVLSGPEGKEELRLLPGIEKKVHQPEAHPPAKAGKRLKDTPAKQ